MPKKKSQKKKKALSPVCEGNHEYKMAHIGLTKEDEKMILFCVKCGKQIILSSYDQKAKNI